jgi:hypothetical protein
MNDTPLVGKMYRLRKDSALGIFSHKSVRVLTSGHDHVLVEHGAIDLRAVISIDDFNGAKLLTKSKRRVYENGTVIYYLIGAYHQCIHRTDGPAHIVGGQQSWYVNGIRMMSNADFQQASGISDEDMMVLILKYGGI